MDMEMKSYKLAIVNCAIVNFNCTIVKLKLYNCK